MAPMPNPNQTYGKRLAPDEFQHFEKMSDHQLALTAEALLLRRKTSKVNSEVLNKRLQYESGVKDFEKFVADELAFLERMATHFRGIDETCGRILELLRSPIPAPPSTPASERGWFAKLFPFLTKDKK